MPDTTNPQTAEPLRIPIAHSVRYAARGLPEVPNQYGRGVLAPSEITLTYRAAPDSGLGRVHAYVAGRLWVDGVEIPLLPSGLYGQHYDDGLDGWPEWLAEEARLHDPDADRAAVLDEAADDEGDELVCVDECGLCDACGMEPFGTPAEGWREAARFLRRTARESGDRQGALHGARLIETELRRLAAEERDEQPGTTAFSPGEGVHGRDPYYAGEEQPRFVRVCVACPECDHTLDENGACANGCHVPPAVVAEPGKETDNPRSVCVCGHTRGEHVTVSGRLLCDECNPDSTENLVCKEFEAP